MKRTDAANHVANRFNDRNLVTGDPGTTLEQTWLNAVQEEIAAVIEGFGETLDGAAENQMFTVLLAEIRKLFQYSDLAADGWIVSGLAAIETVLSVTINPGWAVTQGVRTELVSGEATRTFIVPVNSDTYVEIRSDGKIYTSSVANGLPAPSITGLALYVVVSDGTTVTAVTQIAASSAPFGNSSDQALVLMGEDWVGSGLTVESTQSSPPSVTIAPGVAVVSGTRVEITALDSRYVSLPAEGIHVVSLKSDGTFAVITNTPAAASPLPEPVAGLPIWIVGTIAGLLIGTYQATGFRRRSLEPIEFRESLPTVSVPSYTVTDLITTGSTVPLAWGITKSLHGASYGYDIPEGIVRFRVCVSVSFETNASSYQQVMSLYYNGVSDGINYVLNGANSYYFESRAFFRVPGAAITFTAYHTASSAMNVTPTVRIVEC